MNSVFAVNARYVIHAHEMRADGKMAPVSVCGQSRTVRRMAVVGWESGHLCQRCENIHNNLVNMKAKDGER
jgi:hypothetical protein